jgi:hypothetical protein
MNCGSHPDRQKRFKPKPEDREKKAMTTEQKEEWYVGQSGL